MSATLLGNVFSKCSFWPVRCVAGWIMMYTGGAADVAATGGKDPSLGTCGNSDILTTAPGSFYLFFLLFPAFSHYYKNRAVQSFILFCCPSCTFPIFTTHIENNNNNSSALTLVSIHFVSGLARTRIRYSVRTLLCPPSYSLCI